MGSGIPVTFYIGDPEECAPIPGCSLSTERILPPGTCAELSCRWAEPPAEPTDVTVVADDDGSCSGAVGERECHEGNNMAFIASVVCGGPG